MNLTLVVTLKYQLLKTLVSRFIACFMLLLLWPVLLVISIGILLSGSNKIFFTQERPGLNGNIFKLIKFKTMLDISDEDGNPLSDNLRLTKFGSFLRKFSLDELPQLINVIRGEMAFIGPRPLLVEYIPLYDDVQMTRHQVLPGMTGLAQVSGRNKLTWAKKFELDVYYVNNESLWLDLKILYQTFLKVLITDGVNASKELTVEPFRGNN